MVVFNVLWLWVLELELVVFDVIMVCGGMVVELLGILWVEFNLYLLYLLLKGLLLIGSGLVVGIGICGWLCDVIM